MRETASLIIRLPARTHAKLKSQALGRGLSLNRLCLGLLEGESAINVSPEKTSSNDIVLSNSQTAVAAIVEKILARYPKSLRGVVMYGSVARGTETATSDLDLLLVLQDDIPLDRDLYTNFPNFFYKGLKVSPLFVHLPKNIDKPSGIWLETALEGIVLYDLDMSVSKFLTRLRHLIASGSVKRMLAQGHPYWVYENDQ